jgi:hypothetical protein
MSVLYYILYSLLESILKSLVPIFILIFIRERKQSFEVSLESIGMAFWDANDQDTNHPRSPNGML